MSPLAPDPAYMATLSVGYALAAAVSALVAGVLFGLRARHPRAHLTSWAAAFAASALGQVAAGLALLTVTDQGHVGAPWMRTVLSIFAGVGAWLFAALLVAGAEELDRGRGLPARTRAAALVALAGVAIALVLATLDASPAVRLLFRVGMRSVVVALAFVLAASVILRRHRARLGGRIVAGAFGVSAAIQAATAVVFVLRVVDPEFRLGRLSQYLPALDVVIAATLGLGLVIWLLEEERARTLTLAAERQRAEAERSLLLDQLRQSQKMEAVGRLAGGVAHDIKNLLTVIESWLEPLGPDAPEAERGEAVGQILAAHGRAVRLSRQLLALAGAQPLNPRAFDLAALARETAALLPKSLPLRASLEVRAAEPVRVEADADQMSQVILNLALNARDAIGEGGRIMLRVGVLDLAVDAWFGPDAAPPGRYALLEVEDDGVGIDPAGLARLFEPFYTTKPPGVGTGLGLSTAYGIVRQSGGFIGARSVPGKGTTFAVVLPLADAGPAAPGAVERRAAAG